MKLKNNHYNGMQHNLYINSWISRLKSIQKKLYFFFLFFLNSDYFYNKVLYKMYHNEINIK